MWGALGSVIAVAGPGELAAFVSSIERRVVGDKQRKERAEADLAPAGPGGGGDTGSEVVADK